MLFSGLSNLAVLRDARSRRISSYDLTGGNEDFPDLDPLKRETGYAA
jgi:hypothetical protein